MRGARPVALVLALTTLGACADEARIEAKDAWIAEAPPGAQVLAAYVQLHNRSGEPLRCDGVYGAEFGAAEIHRTLIEDGRSRMLRGQTIEAPAGARTTTPSSPPAACT
jgi:periplasmic copper chaperone A